MRDSRPALRSPIPRSAFRVPQLAAVPGSVWLVAALLPVYLVLAAVLPASDDEIYYWCWAQQLQLSYYDHPPMTAYMIRAATAVFGDTVFALRLPAVVSTLTVVAVIASLTRPRRLLPLILLTPLFTFGAVLVTPDTPLLMFWALYLAWLVAVHRRIDGQRKPGSAEAAGGSEVQGSTGVPPWLWLVGGVVLGCGILGKYTTGLAVMAGFLSFLVAGNWRNWVVGYGAHLTVAFLVSLPILIHNIRHDFVPLQYQWKHSMASPQPGAVPFLLFVGTQLLLFGFLPFATFVWTIARRRELAADPRLRVCACLFAFPFAFFLYKATRGPLEGNWALPCYIAVWPLAAVLCERVRGSATWRRLTVTAFAIPAGSVLVLAVHLVHPIGLIPPSADRITRQAAKDQLVLDLAAQLRQLGANEPVYAPSYQWTALLRFHGVDARQIDGMTRPSHFTQVPERPEGRDHAYVFAEGFLPDEYVGGFGQARILGKYPLVVRGEEVAVFWLLEYSRSGGMKDGAIAPTAGGRLDRPSASASP